jgi:trk/ktr system potassium uptake protein
MRVVILGCGRVGAQLARQMIGDGYQVTIIDTSQSSFLRLGDEEYQERSGIQRVAGDGTDPDVLKRAGIEVADCFVAVTNGDNRNLLASQIAQHTFSVPRVICRVYDPKRKETFDQLGLICYCPTLVGAAHIKTAIDTGALP